MLVAILFGLILPITPLQILWVNMITAVTLALALAFEPADEGLMCRPPRDPRLPLLSPVLLWRIVWISVLMMAASLGLFLYSQQLGWSLESSHSLAVNALMACEIGYLFSSRSLHGAARFGWRDNPVVWAMVLLLCALQLALTYWAPLQGLFATGALPLLAWVWCLGAAIGLCALVELEKYLLRHWQVRA